MNRIVTALILGCLLATAAHGARTVQLMRTDDHVFFWDLNSRHRELRLFEQGIYPRKEFLPEDLRSSGINTVYPPNALVLYWFLAPFDSLKANQTYGVAVNLLGLGVVLAFAWRLGRATARLDGVLMVTAVTAMQSVSSGFRVGQPGLLLSALLLCAMLLLARGRPLAAGGLWALTLVKPTNTLFAGLALLSRRGVWGLAVAAGITLGCATLAALWTGHSLTELLSLTYSRTGLRFTVKGGSLVSLMHGLAVPPHAGTWVGAIAGLALMGVFRMYAGAWAGPLTWLAVAGYANRVFFYHAVYDDALLVFLLLALLRGWLSDRRPMSLAAALGVGLSLWLPLSTLLGPNSVFAIQLVPWTLGLAWLLRREARGGTG